MNDHILDDLFLHPYIILGNASLYHALYEQFNENVLEVVGFLSELHDFLFPKSYNCFQIYKTDSWLAMNVGLTGLGSPHGDMLSFCIKKVEEECETLPCQQKITRELLVLDRIER